MEWKTYTSTQPPSSEDQMTFNSIPIYPSTSSSFPSSSTPSRADYNSPVTGLGISNCDTNDALGSLRLCPPSAPAPAPPEAYAATPTAGWIESAMHSDPLQSDYSVEVGPYSNTTPYEPYNSGQHEFSASPLSLYSAQTLSASPSYSWAMELGENYGPLGGQQQQQQPHQQQHQQQQQQDQGYWSITPRSDITTPPTNFIHVKDEPDEYWDPSLFAEKTKYHPLEASSMILSTPQVVINTCPDSLFSGSNDHSYSSSSIKQEPTSGTCSSTSSLRDAVLIEPQPSSVSEKNSSITPPPTCPLPVSNVNTGGSGFDCDICGMRFTRRSNCREHRKKHDNNKQMYACDCCPQTFGRKTDRKRHVESVSLLFYSYQYNIALPHTVCTNLAAGSSKDPEVWVCPLYQTIYKT